MIMILIDGYSMYVDSLAATLQRALKDRDWLITVCAGCHARIHRRGALRILIPELLVAIWSEQHPDTPVPLQLPAAT